MARNKPPQQEESIEDVLDKVDLSEKTEMEGVADQVFKPGSARTLLDNEEISNILICDVVMTSLGLDDVNPTNNFKELKKSLGGWSTEQFVRAASGIQDQRAGGGFMNGIKGLFTPKKPGM